MTALFLSLLFRFLPSSMSMPPNDSSISLCSDGTVDIPMTKTHFPGLSASKEISPCCITTPAASETSFVFLMKSRSSFVRGSLDVPGGPKPRGCAMSLSAPASCPTWLTYELKPWPKLTKAKIAIMPMSIETIVRMLLIILYLMFFKT